MANKLPKNWVETEFKELASFVIGGDWGKDLEFEFDVESELVSCIRGSEIKNWERDKGSTSSIRKVKSSSLEKRALIEGDILIEISGGGPDQPVGRTLFIDKEALNVNSEYKKVCTNFLRMVRLYDNLDKKFIKNYLDSFYLSGEVLKYQGGSNNLRNLKFKEFETIKIPLPPLAEQQRIVAKLDVLFNHLDTLKARLNHIPQLLKNFRQAVLTQAVIGKLTEEWRKHEKNNKATIKEEINDDYFQYDLPKSWVNTIIQNIGSVKGGKRLPKGEKLLIEDTGYPYIRARDLKKGTVLVDNLMYLSESVQEKIKRYIVATDDVYITIVGAKIGDAGIIPKEMNGANLTENAAKITDFIKELDAKYFSLFLRSSVCQANIQNAIMSAAQGKLALTRIKQLPIYLPPKEEQTEIVKRVEALFAKADTIENQYQNLKTKIDSLPQAILAKAFKGELVEQLDTDGSAKVLLEEIHKLKKEVVGKKKTRNKKK